MLQLFCRSSILLIGIAFSDLNIGSYYSVAMKDFLSEVSILVIFSLINEWTGAIAAILSSTPDISVF